ncbi:ATP-binding cassette domain-containing protein [Alteribacillus sp. HJP-4]|uniref:ATP-binding cassette domain-containing protein n=1 Tax=Alteribacillus sp. HJP-4 TaxID=2775394 RepID=UPI0035CCFB88
MTAMSIKADQLSLKLGKNKIIKDITFELEGGKIYGLLGRNGAGKTTLLSLLAAFNKPTGGRITVDGEDTFENRKMMESIMFVRDVKRDDETETVKKWMEGPEEFRPNFDRPYADDLVRRFKLPLDQQVNKLSRGMQSALSVIVGLASRAPITIFDEAYLGMDAPARKLFYDEVLQDYMKHPRTIILSTHLISEMDSLFEEVVMLQEGSMLLHESAEELSARGTTVTGQKENVDRFIEGKKVLNNQVLGATKSAMVYGEITDNDRKAAGALQLELGQMALQDLFIYLTEEENHDRQ